MERSCLECGETVIGRSDRKFCSDHCRNAYNNELNRSSRNLMRNTHNRLGKNRRILEQLNSKEITKVKRSTLLKSGFLFDYITGLHTTKKGDTYYYVYDQGYLPLSEDWYLLVTRDIT